MLYQHMRVAALIAVLLTSSAAFAQPFAIPAPDPVPVPAAYNRTYVDIAASAEGALVIWPDQRPGGGVRGSFVSLDGEPIDADFAITGDVDIGANFGQLVQNRDPFAVASNGRDYLVAYSAYEPGPYPRSSSTRFVRLRHGEEPEPREGQLPGGIRSLAAAGEMYVVATVPRAGGPAELAVIDPHGRVVRSGLRIVRQQDGLARDAVVYRMRDGSLLLAWPSSTRYGVDVARVTLAELLAEGFDGMRAVSTIAPARLPVSFAEGDFGILAAWIEDQALWTATLDKEGKIINAASRIVGVPLAYMVSSAAAGGTYGILINHHRGVNRHGLVHLHTAVDGRPFGGEPTVVFDLALSIAVTQLPAGRALVAFTSRHENHVEDSQVYVARHSIGGGVGFPELVSRSVTSQETPVVVSCRGITTIAWQERSGFNRNVRYRRYGQDGLPLGPARDANPGDWLQEGLTLSCGAHSALLSWTQMRPWQFFADRVRRGLLLPDTGEAKEMEELAPGSRAAAAFDGTNYVVWSAPDNGMPNWTRWNEEGQWVSRRELSTGVGYSDEIALAWNGERFLAVWEESIREGAGSKEKIVAQLWDRNANRIGPVVEVTPLTYGGGYDQVVAAASPHGWLISWHDGSSGQPQWSARLARDGALLDPLGGLPTGEPGAASTVSWNGGAYELIDRRGVVTRTESGGVTIRELPYEVAALAPIGDRRIVVYRRIDPESGQYRLFTEIVDATDWTRRAPRRRSAAAPR